MDPIFCFPASPAPHFKATAKPLFPISASQANCLGRDPNDPQLLALNAHSEAAFRDAPLRFRELQENCLARPQGLQDLDVQPKPKGPQLAAGLAAFRDRVYEHQRASSDVQDRVAQFNTMSKEAAQRRKDHEASLQRAVLGREQAESDSRKLREENRILRMQVEEGKARERRVGERIEGVMGELQRAHETHAHSQRLYEAEVRRARKEAFKASSALVKVQEELKSTRNKYTLMREEVEVQKRKVEDHEQHTFMAEYKAAGLQEEVDSMTEQLKASYDVREVYKACLKEADDIRDQAEQRVSLSISREEDGLKEELWNLRQQMKVVNEEKALAVSRGDGGLERELENLKHQMEVFDEEKGALEASLKAEEVARITAEETINFMQMECQFQCCCCRIAEKHGKEYIHDDGPAAKFGMDSASKEPDIDIINSTTGITYQPPTCSSPLPEQDDNMAERQVEFSPATGTFFSLPESTTSPEVMSPVRLARLPSR